MFNLNTRRLVTWIAFLGVFAMAARVSVDPDSWWHIRAGEWMVENRAILSQDLFSYTRLGAEWHYPGWLVEVPMYLIFRSWGPGGLNLWTAAMVTLAMYFVWRTLDGEAFLRAFLIIFAATAAGVYWAARPYLVTFLFTAIFLALLECYRKENRAHHGWMLRSGAERRLIWLPVLMVLWVNSHGGMISGVIVWGVYAVSELANHLFSNLNGEGKDARKQSWVTPLWTVGALMAGAILINPYGWAMFGYPFKTIGMDSLQNYIQEWQSPDFHDLAVQPFAWLLLGLIAAVGFSRKRILISDFLLSAGFGYMALLAGRNIALFALVAPMVISRHLASINLAPTATHLEDASPHGQNPAWMHRLNWGILILVLLAVTFKVSNVIPRQANERVFRQTFPASAVEYMRQMRPQGRMFNSYNFGGYLLWHLPEYPVFIDGRTDLYDDRWVDLWLQVMTADQGWQSILQEFGVNTVLIENGSRLDQELRQQSQWLEVYRDSQAVIYLQR